ncbi:DUF1686 domain-containing protein [Encephalitozoon cuniculi]|nr:DUF1686 domain-containing protein [Encephalitozoon cuniculi]
MKHFKPTIDNIFSISEEGLRAIEGDYLSEEEQGWLLESCEPLTECQQKFLEAYGKFTPSPGEDKEDSDVSLDKLKEKLEETVRKVEGLKAKIRGLKGMDDDTPKDTAPPRVPEKAPSEVTEEVSGKDLDKDPSRVESEDKELLEEEVAKEIPEKVPVEVTEEVSGKDPDKDPSKAEGEDKEPLEEAPSPVRRAVASLDTGRPFGNLCLVFVLVLAVQGLLRVSGMEHSTLGVSWNTALYSLAVAGAVTYQLWVLAEGCRRGGAGSMARQGWSAVACMAPMLVAVPHAGVIRSSMYSVAVAGLAAVTLYVQDAARRGMPWREACAVGAGNAVLAAACAAGSVAPADGVCGRPFWVWMGVVVFVSLLLAVSYAERGGKRAEGGGVWGCGCECAACDDGCGWDDWVACVWACLPRDVCGGGGWKYLPSDEIE